jgi:hypothetical protein
VGGDDVEPAGERDHDRSATRNISTPGSARRAIDSTPKVAPTPIGSTPS